MKKLLLIAFGFLLISFTLPEKENTIRWEIIGHQKINNQSDKVEIPIKVMSNKSAALRFSINNGTTYIHHSKVYFDNEEVQTIPLRREYHAGNLSKIIDLRGGKRNIIKCEIYITPDRFAKVKPVIELWAKTEVDQ